MLLVFQVRLLVSEVAAILYILREALKLWYVMRISQATSLTTKRRRRVVCSAKRQSIKRVLRTDLWGREHGLLRIGERQRVVRATRQGKRGLRRHHIVIAGGRAADHVGRPKKLRIVEADLRCDELAMATRRVLEIWTSWL